VSPKRLEDWLKECDPQLPGHLQLFEFLDLLEMSVPLERLHALLPCLTVVGGYVLGGICFPAARPIGHQRQASRWHRTRVRAQERVRSRSSRATAPCGSSRFVSFPPSGCQTHCTRAHAQLDVYETLMTEEQQQLAVLDQQYEACGAWVGKRRETNAGEWERQLTVARQAPRNKSCWAGLALPRRAYIQREVVEEARALEMKRDAGTSATEHKAAATVSLPASFPSPPSLPPPSMPPVRPLAARGGRCSAISLNARNT